ncbi:MAG TPA: hypothetical protein DE312_04345 [Gallionella sp.]|nr:hypothetical protein [Gallionella sp.]OGS67682.1 MAG: hypothetical protein A2Z87_05960 [Gallionellales bacterium GWA2_54_124]HCI52533.1 hypothetical protein [Gallionella sp.]
MFGFSLNKDTPELLAAIDYAAGRVEPLLRQTGGYPGDFRKPVINALQYAQDLAAKLPGPVCIDSEAYALDAYVHAIFPSSESFPEAINMSRAMQDYFHKVTDGEAVFALLGMRRIEKSSMGMALSGHFIQQDVAQHVVYFGSHTIENPAPSEALARKNIAWSFFDSLLSKVAKRVSQRKQKLQSQRQERALLVARLRTADRDSRPALEAELAALMDAMADTTRSLDLRNYSDDFEAVLCNPEHALRLTPSVLKLDAMGVKLPLDAKIPGKTLVFDELTGFDRRDWTVTMVRFHAVRGEKFTERLDAGYRMLSC